MVRLQEELQHSHCMLAAKEEGEVLLKAEVMQLTEEVGRLKAACSEHQSVQAALQAQVQELTQMEVCTVPHELFH